MQATTSTTPQETPVHVAVSVEGMAYIVIILTAVLLRVVGLGALPLNVSEIPHAFAAWAAVDPTLDSALVPTSALLHNLTALLMTLGGVDEAAVRLPAAVAGVALTLTPLLFRQHLGRLTTLIGVLLLAILPSAVLPARVAGGEALSLLFVMLTLAALYRYTLTPDEGWLWAAAVSLAAAFLADYGTLVIIIGLMIAALLTLATDEEGALAGLDLRRLPWRNLALIFAASVLLGAVGFFLVPGGLAGLAESLRLFTLGLTQRVPGIMPLPVLLALYEPLLIIFGVVGAALAFRSPSPYVRFLGGWGIAMLFLALVYQGGQPGHMLWVTVPFALLTAYATREILDLAHEGPTWGVWLFTLTVLIVIALMLFTLSMHVQRPNIVPIGSVNVSLQIVLTIMWLILMAAIWTTAAFFYGPEMGTIGTWLGVVMAAVVLAFGHSVDIAFTRQANPYELAMPAQAQPSLSQMLATMEQTSELGAGGPTLASLTVQAPRESVIGWAVRDYEDAQFVTTLNASITSDMVITPLAGSDQPTLGSEYVGQSYVITRQWTAENATAADMLEWLLYHRLDQPTLEEAVILWVREDLYRIGQSR